MMKKYQILENITGVLLTVTVILTISVVMQISTKGYVTLSGYSLFKVATGSMEPTIKTGSLLICEDETIDDIKVMDIVCFESTNPMMMGQVITHRVVAIDEINGVLRLTTQGDANTVSDPLYVTADNLIGKVKWYSTDEDILANAVSFLNGKIGFLSCIVLPVLLLSTMMMKESVSSIQREMKELKRLEKQAAWESEEEMIQRLKQEIRIELGLSDPEEETEEQMIERLKKEIREELGLIDTKEKNEQ